jgi:hypothetical protein
VDESGAAETESAAPGTRRRLQRLEPGEHDLIALRRREVGSYNAIRGWRIDPRETPIICVSLERFRRGKSEDERGRDARK